MFTSARFDIYLAQHPFKTTKEVNLLKQRIQPAVRDAVVRIEGARVMKIVMRWTQEHS